MKCLIALAFSALSTVAAAQVVPPCYSAPIGTGTQLRSEADYPGAAHAPYGPNQLPQRSGWAYGWSCPPDGRIFWAVGLWENALPDWLSQTRTAVYGGKTALDAFMAANLVQTPLDPSGVPMYPWGLDGVVQPMYAAVRADSLAAFPPPGAAVWVVKGPGTTRVVYTLLPGPKRGTVTALTVPVGAICDQSVKIVEPVTSTLTNVYMAVPGGVAVCVPKP